MKCTECQDRMEHKGLEEYRRFLVSAYLDAKIDGDQFIYLTLASYPVGLNEI